MNLWSIQLLKKTSNEAFQALWIEIQSSQKCNIICGIVYIQHISPQQFQEYFDETLEKLIASNKSVYIVGDFNINLLHAESSRYAQEFLLSVQSFSFQPTRAHNSSATLIDNILTNKVDANITIFHSFVSPTLSLRSWSRKDKSAEIFLGSPLIGLTLNSRRHS